MHSFLRNNWVSLLVILVIGTTYLLKKDLHNKKIGPLYQFESDVACYYSFTPAFLLYNDPYFTKTTQYGTHYDIKIGDKRASKYTIGMALMYSPSFLLAKLIDPKTEELSHAGLSVTYSRVVRTGSFIYFFVGLFFLIKLLQVYFNKATVLASTLIVFFGTNLLFYTYVESEMPHLYLFSLISLILYCSYKYWLAKENKYLYFLSFLVGMSALIRPSELTIALIPLLWGIKNRENLISRFQYFLEIRVQLLVSFLIFMVPISLQMLYWKGLTGSFIINSFEFNQEGFFFLQPKIWDFLFSYRKGWFVYTPVMFFAIIGFLQLRKQIPELFAPFLILISINIYLLSSWWCWWFGGGLGMRSMVQYYPILLFPLACLIEVIFQKKYLRFLALGVFAFSIYLNIDFTKKYLRAQLHWDSMSKESFWFVFLKDSFTREDYSRLDELIDPADYKGAKSGENR